MFALVIVSRSHLELEIFRQLQIQRQTGGENETIGADPNTREQGNRLSVLTIGADPNMREQGNRLSVLIANCIKIWIVKIDTIVSLYYQLFVI